MTLLSNLLNDFFCRGGKGKFGKSVSLRPLTSKRANRRFYKGKGCRKEGKPTRKGGFMTDVDKLLTLEVPDLTGFKLKAYVSPLVPSRPPQKV